MGSAESVIGHSANAGALGKTESRFSVMMILVQLPYVKDHTRTRLRLLELRVPPGIEAPLTPIDWLEGSVIKLLSRQF